MTTILKPKFALSFLPAALLASPVLAQTLPLRDGYYGHMWGDGFGMGFFGSGMMLLFWGVIIFLVVMAVRWFGDRDSGGSTAGSAIDILKDRLAKGEIEPEDYELRRKALEV